ncbi:MAG: hypothetical protein GX121_02625 [Ignavibacteria bacterium]|jgi:hypothetical protein|nr:hypothetical protein [Ignavibacteria bacterium]
MNKTFDCVKYQRDIRDKFIEEANGDFRVLLENLRAKAKKSELYHFFKERKEKHLRDTVV